MPSIQTSTFKLDHSCLNRPPGVASLDVETFKVYNSPNLFLVDSLAGVAMLFFLFRKIFILDELVGNSF